MVGIFAGPYLIALVSEPGAYRDAADGYFYWLLLAVPGFMLAFTGNGILQAHGDSVTMQRAMMVAFSANIGLNPLFIYGAFGISGLGINGIALATIVSQTGVMLYVLRTVLRLRITQGATVSDLIPSLPRYRQIFMQMLPTSTAMAVMFVSGFVVQYALKGFGGDAIAAYDNHARVREAVWFCWKLGLCMTIGAAPILWFGGGFAMSLFTDNENVIEIGHSYLKVDSFLFILYMMLFSINSLLQALKRPIWTLWISIYRQGIGVGVFVWLLVGVFDMDVRGVWLGIAIAVSTGWIIALGVAQRVARQEIGGLR